MKTKNGMRISLRTKLIILISLLIIIILGMNAGVLITQKLSQGQADLKASATSYTSLSHKVIGDAQALYGTSGFINLKNVIEKQLILHPDVTNIQIINYNGDLLFDSIDNAPRTKFDKVSSDIMHAVQGRFSQEQNIITHPDFLEIIYPYYDDFENHAISVRYTFSFDRIVI